VSVRVARSRRLVAEGYAVGFANSGGLVFVDESAEEITTL